MSTTITPSRVRSYYTRNDTRGGLPTMQGLPPLPHNRLALLWRPIVDLNDSPYAAMRLQFVAPISHWIANPEQARWPMFAMIGVSGIRHQVLAHAGLSAYECEEPGGLRPELRTQRWRNLVEAVEHFADLDYRMKALVVFQLAQLSFCRFAIRLAGRVEPSGDPDHDRYAHMVGRIYARYPDGHRLAIPLFERLAHSADDPALGLEACFQGIGHTLRNAADYELPTELEQRGHELAGRLDDGWRAELGRSRLHRSLALLRMWQRRLDDMAVEIARAHDHSDRALAIAERADDAIQRDVALENRRIIVESQIKAAARAEAYRRQVDVVDLCEQLLAIDPNCLYTLIVVGEGHAGVGDYRAAARWYERAGQLGTAAGSVAWFRAAQCHQRLGDDWAAANAMGRCLELDTSVVEARDFMEAALVAQPDADTL